MRKFIGLRRASCLLATAVLLTAVLWLLWRETRERPYRNMRAAIVELQSAVEDYALHHDGHYPLDISDLFSELHIGDIPNPFGLAKIELLKASEPWRPGCVVYIGCGPPVGVASSRDEARKQVRLMTPSYVNYYWLIAYGPKTKWDSQKLRERVLDNISDNDLHGEALRTLVPLTEADAIENVAWDQVVLLGSDAGEVSELYKSRDCSAR
jgi:hypothetical protein